jgi:hypothetical protein
LAGGDNSGRRTTALREFVTARHTASLSLVACLWRCSNFLILDGEIFGGDTVIQKKFCWNKMRKRNQTALFVTPMLTIEDIHVTAVIF